MRNPSYSSIDERNGNVMWNGPLAREKGNHNNMPSRGDSYLQDDIRFHVNASSLGGTNGRSNVVPGNNDVDKISWTSIENGERNAMNNGGDIYSQKTAVVDSKIGDRPTNFLVTDTVTYADHSEVVSHSFLNESFEEQTTYNNISSSLPDVYEAPNPGDGLREEMSSESYTTLMEATDLDLPTIETDYEQADFSGLPNSFQECENVCEENLDTNCEETVEMEVSAEIDI